MAFKKLALAGALLLSAGAAGWYFYDRALPVALVGAITRGTFVQAVPANILVTEEFRTELKSEHGGRVLKSAVKLGMEVKAGDVLFELDTKDLDIEIRRIEADQKAAKARIELGSPLRFQVSTAEETVRNNTRLVEQGKLAQVDLDRAKRAVDQLKDQIENEKISNQQSLDTFETTLETKRLQRERMRVVAPDDGTISEMFKRTGDLVGGGEVLARLISKARLVQAQISEENFAGVRPGLSAKVQLLGYGGKLFNAKVESVLPSADERTKRYTAFLNLEIDEVLLAPGLTGDASITIENYENALLAERRAMMGHNVFVVKDGRAKLVHATVNEGSMNYTQVVSGVAEGDLIILENPTAFRDGQKVKIRVLPPERR